MKVRIIIAMTLSLFILNTAYAAQSTIVDSEGTACMGDNRSRKQTEQAALTDAKQKAVEHVSTYLKSETEVKNFVLEKDLMSAYANAEVKLIQQLSKDWYKDPNAGDCLKLKIKAEVVPDTAAVEKMAKQSPAIVDDPSAPLTVKAWTDKKSYKQGEKVKVYIKGNKPFYARVLYKDAGGQLVQILPNPHRTENYFNGGTIYEIPSGGDRFELEVSQPFGEENIVVYASSSPLGEISTQTRGGLYTVKTKAKDLAMKTRGIKITDKGGNTSAPQAAEFFEDTVLVSTSGN
jgi:hypothetical protein